MTAPSPDGGADQQEDQETDSTIPPFELRSDTPDITRRFDWPAEEADDEETEPAEPISITDLDRDDIVMAIRRVFAGVDTEGLPREEAIRQTAYALGFERAGPRIKETIDNALRAACQRGVVYSEGGHVYADCRDINDYPRDLLKKALLAVMGRTWWDRDDAIRAAAYHLGFTRAGTRIRKAFGSAITGLIRQRKLERESSTIRRL